jgi:hypothetical protein
LRDATLRGVTFLGVLCREATFFFAIALAAFVAGLLFKANLALVVFLVAAFCATARLAFGLAVLAVAMRRFAAGFGAARRATSRDVERLKPLVTALMSKLRLIGQMWTMHSGSCGGRVT